MLQGRCGMDRFLFIDVRCSSRTPWNTGHLFQRLRQTRRQKKWDKQRRRRKIDSPLHSSLYSWCYRRLLILLWCHSMNLVWAEVRTEVCYSAWPVLQINEKLLRLQKKTSAPWVGSHLWRLFSRWRGSSRQEVTSKSSLWSVSKGLWGNCLIYATAWIKKLKYDVTVSKKLRKKKKPEMNFACPAGFCHSWVSLPSSEDASTGYCCCTTASEASGSCWSEHRANEWPSWRLKHWVKKQKKKERESENTGTGRVPFSWLSILKLLRYIVTCRVCCPEGWGRREDVAAFTVAGAK